MNANTKFKHSFGQSHAFLVGINDYQYESNLHNAINDVEAIAQILREETVHDFIVHKPLLNATFDELSHLLEVEIPKLLKAEDRVLFYFAGHGIATPSQEGRPEGYLLPSDANTDRNQSDKRMLAMSDLNVALDKLPCKHFFLVLDCCFAGAFQWANNKRSNVSLPKKIYRQHFDRYVSDPAWQVLTSSSYDQEAFDSSAGLSVSKTDNRGQQQNSPFATLFMEALKGEADVVPNDQSGGDGLITAHEMYLYIRDKLELQTMSVSKKDRQTPGLFSLSKHDKGQFLFLSPKKECNLPEYKREENPYKGLQTYDVEDSTRFFGREDESRYLTREIRQQQLTLIIGAAGSGKSSLLRAEIIPSMKDFQTLFISLDEKNFGEINTLLSDVDFSQKTILYLDHLERLRSSSKEIADDDTDQQERDQLIARLEQLLQQQTHLKIVATVRADTEQELKNIIFATRWDKSRRLLDSSAIELRDIVQRPAHNRQVEFDPPKLVDDILKEVKDAPGVLPLLSDFMKEMYEQMKSRVDFGVFKQEDYDALGGVLPTLYKRADAFCNSLTSTELLTMRAIFLRMVYQEEERGELLKRPVLKKELNYTHTPDGEESIGHTFLRSEIIEKVLEKLVAERLIVASTNQGGEIIFEPVHEALMLSWPKMEIWIEEFGRSNLFLLNKQVYEASKEYHKNGHTKDLWHNNTRLDTVRMEIQRLNAAEKVFVEKSFARKKKNSRQLIGLSAFAIAALSVLTIFAFLQRNEAQRRAEQAKKLRTTLLTTDDKDISVYDYLYTTGYDLFHKGAYRDALTYLANARFVENVDSLESLITSCEMGIEANQFYLLGKLKVAKAKYDSLQISDPRTANFTDQRISHLEYILEDIKFIEEDARKKIKDIEQLSFEVDSLDILPEEVKYARTLDLSSNQLAQTPRNIHLFKNLEELFLNDNNLQTLPDSFWQLNQLQKLELRKNASLMDNSNNLIGIGKMAGNLRELDLSKNETLQYLPDDLTKLENLRTLDLSNCNLNRLPSCFGELSSLEELNLRGNKDLNFLPVSFSNLGNLAILRLDIENTSYQRERAVKNSIILGGYRPPCTPPGGSTENAVETLDFLKAFEQDILEVIVIGRIPEKGSPEYDEPPITKQEGKLTIVLFTSSDFIPSELNSLKKLKRLDISRSGALLSEEKLERLELNLPEGCQLIMEDTTVTGIRF
ncbi:MAG: caspase family protein [Bacteroidota bacterium]